MLATFVFAFMMRSHFRCRERRGNLMDGSITGDIFDNAQPEKKDTTAAERQRRYRERKRNANCDTTVTDRDAPERNAVTHRGGTLMQPQAGVTWETTEDGDLILRQEGQSDGKIFISANYLSGFLDDLYALDTSPEPAAPPAEEAEPEPVTVGTAVTESSVTLFPEDDDDKEDDDESVVIEGRRRVRVFWNRAGGVSIECEGAGRDYDIIGLHPYEADAAARAILRLLESEEAA
jgi:hypothetical protein